ncbi:hypothetical protein CC78DRAFT_590169 [Lojkania enalia]|uniref:Uncharacterized protein n=1 Tax=Lojkania enalia TaxID=147567 RepID=A0A9P4KHN9_9PLEO|nr:hypothetical protein CC78DRAFT_590169 [Didymosphaeria enalia]
MDAIGRRVSLLSLASWSPFMVNDQLDTAAGGREPGLPAEGRDDWGRAADIGRSSGSLSMRCQHIDPPSWEILQRPEMKGTLVLRRVFGALRVLQQASCSRPRPAASSRQQGSRVLGAALLASALAFAFGGGGIFMASMGLCGINGRGVEEGGHDGMVASNLRDAAAGAHPMKRRNIRGGQSRTPIGSSGGPRYRRRPVRLLLISLPVLRRQSVVGRWGEPVRTTRPPALAVSGQTRRQTHTHLGIDPEIADCVGGC